jgi:hypothetical protein
MARQKLDLRRCDLPYFSFIFSTLTLLTKAKTIPISVRGARPSGLRFSPARLGKSGQSPYRFSRRM